MIFTSFVSSPEGLIRVDANNSGVTGVQFVAPHKDEDVACGTEENSNAITKDACNQLSAYFEKRLREFDLPLAPDGTRFQHSVWKALQSVSYGETASYLDIANAIGNPKAVRAVGMANGRNPIAIIVPCHRIIGSNKTLTGYAGGLPRKQYLLNLEGAQGVLWS